MRYCVLKTSLEISKESRQLMETLVTTACMMYLYFMSGTPSQFGPSMCDQVDDHVLR